MLFSPSNKVVIASLTINDFMDELVQHQVIPTNYHSMYTLGYGWVSPLQGSSIIGSLGARSLLHFYLRARVCGGAGAVVLTLYCESHWLLLASMGISIWNIISNIWEFSYTNFHEKYLPKAYSIRWRCLEPYRYEDYRYACRPSLCPTHLKSCYVESSRKTWKSPVYNHYNITLKRCHETQTLTFQFTFKSDLIGHPSLTCHRLDTSQRTSNPEHS